MSDATFAGTLPAIIRTDDHRYIYQGVTYPGVTSVLKTLDKSGALMTWAARETAEAMLAIHEGVSLAVESPSLHVSGIDTLINAVGRDGVIKAATSRSNWKKDAAATLGTQVHALADLHAHGAPLETLVTTDAASPYIANYAEWWQRSGWRLRLSEAVIVAPALPGTVDHEGWGGTFDLLCYDEAGRTVLADIKTGKGVYREAILQLTAYGMAPLVSPMGSAEVFPMPKIDRYVVIHVTRNGVREVELSIGPREWSAWLSVLDLYRWTETVKGKL